MRENRSWGRPFIVPRWGLAGLLGAIFLLVAGGGAAGAAGVVDAPVPLPPDASAVVPAVFDDLLKDQTPVFAGGRPVAVTTAPEARGRAGAAAAVGPSRPPANAVVVEGVDGRKSVAVDVSGRTLSRDGRPLDLNLTARADGRLGPALAGQDYSFPPTLSEIEFPSPAGPVGLVPVGQIAAPVRPAGDAVVYSGIGAEATAVLTAQESGPELHLLLDGPLAAHAFVYQLRLPPGVTASVPPSGAEVGLADPAGRRFASLSPIRVRDAARNFAYGRYRLEGDLLTIEVPRLPTLGPRGSSPPSAWTYPLDVDPELYLEPDYYGCGPGWFHRDQSPYGAWPFSHYGCRQVWAYGSASRDPWSNAYYSINAFGGIRYAPNFARGQSLNSWSISVGGYLTDPDLFNYQVLGFGDQGLISGRAWAYWEYQGACCEYTEYNYGPSTKEISAELSYHSSTASFFQGRDNWLQLNWLRLNVRDSGAPIVRAVSTPNGYRRDDPFQVIANIDYQQG